MKKLPIPITVALLAVVSLSLPACRESADSGKTATVTEQAADTVLSLEEIRTKVGPVDVFHPADGDPPSFAELAKLADGVKAAAAAGNADPEIQGELEVDQLRALQMAAMVLPMNPDEVSVEPYASWLKAQGDLLVHDEISGSWLVPVSEYWKLVDKYKDAAVGDAIAFQAVNAPMGGECEGQMSCNSTFSLRTEGEYLKRFPQGQFTDMALELVNNNMDAMLADWDTQPEEQVETQKTLAEWEAVLAPVKDSDMAKQVRGKLASLQQKPVAAVTPTQGEETPMIVGGMSPADPQDAEVVKAAEFAAAQMGQELDSVLEAAQQVVAGMNYAMTIKLKNGETWKVTVYKDLQGQYSLSESVKQ